MKERFNRDLSKKGIAKLPVNNMVHQLRGDIAMLLTNQQKCIMEILSKVGCIRRDQLLALLYGKYRERVMTMRPEHLTPMLRQLSGISHAVGVENDVIRLITKTANPLLLESIDVMLEITGGCPLQFSIPTSLPACSVFSTAMS